MEINRGLSRPRMPNRGRGHQMQRSQRGYPRNLERFSSNPHHEQSYNINCYQNNEQWRPRGPRDPPQYSNNTNFTCEPCDRFFRTKEMLDEHLTEHITCKLDGCKFTAHANIVMKHIEIQHATNLYSRIKGYETPEEIEKWKAERKQKFPTLEKRILREQLKEDAKAKRHEEWMERQEERNQRGEANKLQRLEREKASQSTSRIIPTENIEENEEAPAEIKNSVYKSSESFQRNDNQFRNQNNANKKRQRDQRPSRDRKSTALPANKSEIILLESFFSLVKFSEEKGKLLGFKKTLWKGKLEIGDADDGQIFEGDIEKEISTNTEGFSITDDEEDEKMPGPIANELSKEKSETKSSNALGSLMGYGSCCDSELEEGELEDAKELIFDAKTVNEKVIDDSTKNLNIDKTPIAQTKEIKFPIKKARSFKLNRIRRGAPSYRGRKSLLDKLRYPQCNTRLKIQHRPRIRRY